MNMANKKKEQVVVIGAGPAGLTAAYYLLKNSNQYKITVLEQDSLPGGISKTITYHGNRMDLGGHRFFSKSKIINELWQELLPVQGQKSIDDKILDINKKLSENGPDPEKINDTFLVRNRTSRIFYNKKFFDYPVSLNPKTISSLGFWNTIKCGFSYLKSFIFKKKVDNLENFYINRFGKKLYSIFFKNYTEKVWGRSPKNISPDWGVQRAKGLSLIAVIKDYIIRTLHIKNKKKETSLIEQFYYPKYGPGQMWEKMASEIEKMGGTIIYNAKVIEIVQNKKKIEKISYEKDNKRFNMKIDYLLSSMPLKELGNVVDNIPRKIKKITDTLPYRDFITVGLIVKKLKLKNMTDIKTLCNIIPDNWIYIQEEDVKIGRMQIFNNWSPYLVNDLYDTVSLGLEYFCNESDKLWNMTDKEIVSLAITELEKMNFISYKDIIDSHVERVKKAYPAYFDSYNEIDIVKEYLNKIENLYCIGRNGQHHYNNMDHSMLTGIEASKNIINGVNDKSNIWNINTEDEYLEEETK